MHTLVLPGAVQRQVEKAVGAFLQAEGVPKVDFASPPGEPSLVDPDSVSWRVFKNPVALFIGGVAAVILELAEPRVRAGVWNHTSFRTDPVRRLQRTGMAAMVTVYAGRSVAERMIAGVGRMHARVSGQTETGLSYSAADPELLDWVQATTSFGFLEAYHRFVRPLSPEQCDRFFAEAAPAAALYGASHAPHSAAAWEAMLQGMLPQLEASPVVFEFLDIIRAAPALPGLARPLQHLLVRGAVEITPAAARAKLRLGPGFGLSSVQARVVVAAAAAADRLPLRNAPPAQACLRMGLSADWLYRTALR